MAEAVTLGADTTGRSWGRHPGHGFSRLKAKASLRPWPRPLPSVQIQPDVGKTIAPAMCTAGEPSQMGMAKIKSSRQVFPSSSIALQFLLGLIRREAVLLQGWEGISATSWPWLTSTFQDGRQLVSSRRGRAIIIRPNRQVARFSRYGWTLVLGRLQQGPSEQDELKEKRDRVRTKPRYQRKAQERLRQIKRPLSKMRDV
ncbi:hypothetical protein Pyn_18497 [Prunus yedoensis var. nudiflora]|uniref:Uncharacterized protein n=1 Tax=Prunus yedoensis var. nudiflora TaxID=2094558 RepID=A0A314XZ93_PRUYE|nr:hypothetical protein Pyn_18497 [Prunus yedoensis var. nudiflora]